VAKKPAPDFVPLPQAVSEIQTSRKCDAATARQIVKDAHRLGDLDLRLRRPDGSTDDQLHRNFWAGSPHGGDPDLVFENGQIDAEMRPRPARCDVFSQWSDAELLCRAKISMSSLRPGNHPALVPAKSGIGTRADYS
jgi:hypothetical protein